MAVDHSRARIEYPRNWHELLAWFPDEAACLRHLERLRWGEGFVCRFCGEVGGGWWEMGDGRRRCSSCRSESSVTAGTIFAGQTAWAWLRKLRRAMVLPGRELLHEVVEIDESYVGARHRGVGGRQLAGRAIVAIAVEGEQAPERVRIKRISDVTRDTLTGFVLDNVASETDIRTDAWAGDDEIGRFPYHHVITNLSASGDPAHVALPHVHIVASLLKTLDLGTHQGSISHHQLDYYLDEFTFRSSRRRARHRGLLFYRLLEGALAADPHPYRALTDRFAA